MLTLLKQFIICTYSTINYTVEIISNKLEIPADLISSEKKEVLIELLRWVPGDYEFNPKKGDVFTWDSMITFMEMKVWFRKIAK